MFVTLHVWESEEQPGQTVHDTIKNNKWVMNY